MEAYITHNGDLDFFCLHQITYPLEEVQQLLSALLHCPMPASVDSACVAGLLDLLRTCGIWRASVRYGYAFGALAESGNLCDHGNPASRLWTRAELDRVVTIFSDEWSRLVADASAQSTRVPSHATDKSRSSKSDPSAKYAKNGDDLESNGKPTSKRSADELRAAMEEAMLQKARGSLPRSLAANRPPTQSGWSSSPSEDSSIRICSRHRAS